MRTLVLGIGNVLLGDEGIGVHLARALAGRELPAGVEVVEAGVAFLGLLPALETAERILIVDAMQAGGEPGSIYRVPFDRCLHPQQLVSLHGFDLSRTLYLAQNRLNPEVVVFGVEPERIDWGMELTAAVQSSLPILAQAILDELTGSTQPALCTTSALSGKDCSR